MNTGGRPRPRHLSHRFRRFAAPHPAGALLVLAMASVAVAAASTHAAGILRVAGIVVLLVSPALLIAAALTGARAVRAVRRRLVDQRDDGTLQPDGPPIEKLAADLRRLLWQHDRVARSADVAMHAWRLRALEGAITICARQAARSLDVPDPEQPIPGGFVQKPQLRRTLRALAAAGLVLPPAVGLLAPDGRR
jgi:hypothetical protein